MLLTCRIQDCNKKIWKKICQKLLVWLNFFREKLSVKISHWERYVAYIRYGVASSACWKGSVVSTEKELDEYKRRHEMALGAFIKIHRIYARIIAFSQNVGIK